MERELLFAQKLQEIRETAKDQGNLVTADQVEETFADFGLEKDQLDMVYDYLNKHHIGVGEPVDTDQYLTGDEKNFLQMYLEEIEALEPLSSGEKEAIVLSAMAGEADAQERLIHASLAEIVDIAKLYAGQGVYLEDLISEGNVAVAMGVKMLGAFENAAEAEGRLMRIVMDAMEDYIAEYAEEEKKDKRIAEKVNKVAKEAERVAKDYGRQVTAEELADESSLSLRMIREAQRISGNKIEDLEPVSSQEDTEI